MEDAIPPHYFSDTVGIAREVDMQGALLPLTSSVCSLQPGAAGVKSYGGGRAPQTSVSIDAHSCIVNLCFSSDAAVLHCSKISK